MYAAGFARLVLGGGMCLVTASIAVATNFSRVAPGGGWFSDAVLWSPTGVPGSIDRANFNLSSMYTVAFLTLRDFPFPPRIVPRDELNDRLRIGDDDVTFDLFGATYTLTSTSATSLSIGGSAFDIGDRGENGRLHVTNGTLASRSAAIGDGSTIFLNAGSGLMDIGSGGTFTSSGQLSIGLRTPGALMIHSGGDANSFLATVGHEEGGTATVTGGGSTWISDSIDVGGNANGTLNIQGGGVVTTTSNTEVFVGVASGVTGTVNVSGAFGLDYSRWYHAGPFVIGSGGNGVLNISAGGQVLSSAFNTTTVVANNSGSSGMVTVNGSGSRWATTNLNHGLIVGDQGTASLAVGAGGEVVFSYVSIGTHPTGSGAVDVQGINSLLTGSGVFVGGGQSAPGGTATLTIGSGATVEAGTTKLWTPGTVNLNGGTLRTGQLELVGGAFNWTSGTLHLTGTDVLVEPGGLFGPSLDLGAGKILRVPRLLVGQNGNGTLTAHDGALIDSLVEFTVGGTAEGEVQVASSTLLTQFSSTIGSQPGSTGTVTVESGGIWEHKHSPITREFIIGDRGTGTLNVRLGGRVRILEQAVPVLGKQAEGVGTLNIDGTGSEMFIQIHDLSVGRFGRGTINVTGGGRLEAPSFVFLGEQPEASGEVLVQGMQGNSSRFVASVIVVGFGGTGSLALENGGAVDAREVFIASFPASSGTVVVNGADSRLTALSGFGHLIIGGRSTGSLTITGGGVAEARDIFVGDGMSGVGQVLVSGNGSRLTASDEFSVGYFGTGALTVTDGGIAAGPLIFINKRSSVGGDGTLDADVANNGKVAPGLSAGLLSIDGHYDQDKQGRLAIELGGTMPGAQHDVLSISGTASLDGTLEVSLINDFMPSAGQTFDILTAMGDISGNFQTEVLPMLSSGLFFDVTYSTSAVTLVVRGIVGDYNGDGTVDAGDYVFWRKNDGTPTGYEAWRANFGRTAGSAAAGSATANAVIPEPSHLALLAIATVALGFMRRHGPRVGGRFASLRSIPCRRE
jgi:T5SS/PEP-CTERM-associated repeat protein